MNRNPLPRDADTSNTCRCPGVALLITANIREDSRPKGRSNRCVSRAFCACARVEGTTLATSEAEIALARSAAKSPIREWRRQDGFAWLAVTNGEGS